MTKIISSPNCGNSPKMEFLKQLNIAFAEGNVTYLTENVTDDIIWNIIGDKKIEGKEAFTEELEKMQALNVTELKLEQNSIARQRRSRKWDDDYGKRKAIRLFRFLYFSRGKG